MTDAKIDELKIVIKADDNAGEKLDEILAKLERLDNLSVGSNTFKDFEQGLEKCRESSEKTEETLQKLGDKTVRIEFEATGNREVEKTADNLAEKAKEGATYSISFEAGEAYNTVEQTTEHLSTSIDDIADASERASNAFGKWNSNTSVSKEKLREWDASVKKSKENLKSLEKQAGKTAGKFFLFPFGQITKGAHKFGSAIGKLFTKLKTVATYRVLRGFIKMVNEGFKEGTQNAYQWSKAMGEASDMGRYARTLDALSTSALYLRNAFGAVAIPILNSLQPAIDALVDKVVDAINVFNRLFATLSGATTWTKAIRYPKEFAKSVDKATGSAKELKEAITILGIDELNPLNAVNEPSGGGGGADDALDYSSMFEEMALEAEGVFSDFFEPLEKAWESKGQALIDSVNRALEETKLTAQSVGDSFKEVWTNGTGQGLAETFLSTLTNISDTWANLSRQFRLGWEFDGNGTRFVQGLADILEDILEMWDDITRSTAEWAGSLDFSGIIDGFADLAEGVRDFLDPITDGLAWAWEHILLPLGKWGIEKGLPDTLSSLGQALGSMGSIFTTIGESKAGEVIGGVLEGMVDLITRISGKTFLTPLKDFSTALKDIADLISGKVTLKDTFTKWLGEISLRVQTQLFYLKQAWEAVKKGNWDKVGEALAGAYDPTHSEYYLHFKAQIDEIEDKRKAKDKVLPFLAEITEQPSGNSNFGVMPTGERYALAGGSANLGKVNFNGTSLEVDAIANFTKANDNIPVAQKEVRNMTAMIVKKAEQFSKVTDPMEANLAKKIETFDHASGSMVANLNRKDETFAKTTGVMTANLAEKHEKFNKITGSMTATLSAKRETFDKTTGAMTANLTKRADNIKSADKWISGVTAYVNSLSKASNFKGLTLSGAVSSGNGKATVLLKKDGGIFSHGFWKKIPQYANGTLNAGSMFIAGENGAEIVGNVGGRTEVLNQSQIAQAMASSMMQANVQQNAILQEQNSLLRQLLAKDSTVTAVLSTSSLIDGANRQNRRTGRAVIPVGV